MRFTLLLSFIVLFTQSFAQNCPCEKEFLHIKGFIEQNYAGFKDKHAQMTETRYKQITDRLLQLSRNAKDDCLLLISSYLDIFKDDHVQIGSDFDATKMDSNYINNRLRIDLSDKKLALLRSSKTVEGIYNLNFDSSYKIAVLKDKSETHDYIGVMIDSKLPSWKKGMIKFEAKRVNDSLLKGILYMRNHMPKVEWFYVGNNQIGGDWQREGTIRQSTTYKYVPVDAKKLSDQTLYLKISSFSGSNAAKIDSLFKANSSLLKSMPFLVLDLRDNGGGSDFSYEPILPYIYTNAVKGIGADVLATEANIAAWKKILDREDIPEKSKEAVRGMVQKMEMNKGKLVNIADDYTDSSMTAMALPKRVVVLVNRGCASTTEQFLLAAKQSSKVILAGENTQGTLDYSNMREKPFSCMPYILRYATTRSRRLDIGEGIDITGIKPAVYLNSHSDWIEQARLLLEK